VLEVLSEIVLKALLKCYRRPAAEIGGCSTAQHIVVLAPHIDDETISCGGTVRRHVLAGDRVTVLFLTDGSRCARAQPGIVEQREAEAERAVRQTLGAQELVFWRYPDQGLAAASDLAERLASALRDLSPDVLYVPSAWDPHRDHVAAANLASAAAGWVRRSVRIYESFCPLTPYGFNRFVDITDVRGAKAAAMDCFSSQVVSFPSIALLNRAQSAVAHAARTASVEVFLEVPPSRYPAVCAFMTSTPVRPRRISQIRNVVRAYLVNFSRTRRMRRSLSPLLHD
jgi:LmbE family N-acetylglucosaminyl deacetylase